MGDKMSVLRRNSYALISVVIILLMWWIVTDVFRIFSSIVLPSPRDVLEAAYLLLFGNGVHLFSGGVYNGSLLGHALISTGRVVLGFSVAVAFAVPLGIGLATSPTLNAFIDPILQLFRPIPPIAWTPLAILWFGIDLKAIVFLILLGAFWPMLLNTISGIREVPKILPRAAACLGARKYQILYTVTVPAALPFLFTGLRLSFGAAWVTIVAAELIASSEGLGYLIMNARRILSSADIIVGMVTIGILGLAFDWAFRRIEKTLYARAA